MDGEEAHAAPGAAGEGSVPDPVRVGHGCNQIVVPLSFAPGDATALDVAATVAREEGLAVHLVVVSSPNLDHGVDRQLVEAQAEALGTVAWTVEVLEGDDVADSLVDWLHTHPQALPVLASHARGAIGTRVLGSVSEQLLGSVHRPMIIVGPHATLPQAEPLVLLHTTMPAPHDPGTVDVGHPRGASRAGPPPVVVVDTGPVDDVVKTIRTAASPVLITPPSPAR